VQKVFCIEIVIIQLFACINRVKIALDTPFHYLEKFNCKFLKSTVWA